MVGKKTAASLALFAGAAMFTIGTAAPRARAATQYTVSDGAISLSNLTGAGNTLLVGDKLFSNFSYSTTGSDMPAASAVTITGETVGSGSSMQWGFKIQGQFQDTPSPGASDALLRYTVTVVDPTAFLISAVGLDGNPSATSSDGGNSKVQVTETWTPDVGNQKVRVYDIEPGDTTQLQDSIPLDTPAASLMVTKDILASVPDAPISSGPFAGPSIGEDIVGDTASIGYIDQLYSQTPTTGTGVPEPASLGLLAVGALGLLGRRRR